MSKLREAVLQAGPEITEEIKWRMATRPEGLPVWSHNGIVCFAETWKDNIKLIFFKGAKITDPKNLFNARLKSTSVRAIEFHEGDKVNVEGIQELVVKAAELNESAS